MQTFPKCWRSAVVLTAFLAAASPWGRSSSAQPPAAPAAPLTDPVVQVTAKRSEVTVTERFSKVIEFQNRVTRVDGFDPEVVNVTALAANQLRIQALATGVTTTVVVDELGAVFTVDVYVVGDVRHLQTTITKMFPRAAIEVVPVRDTVVLRGWVTQPEHVQDVIDVTRRFYPEPINQMRVGGLQLVQLNVVVMEVQRAKIRRLGFNFIALGEDFYLTSTPGNLTSLTGIAAPVGGSPTVSTSAASLADSTINAGVIGDNGLFQAFVEALKTESLLKILAEPKLITTNGRPANMLAGGEFPILVPQSLGTTTIEWREFGVRMEAVPILLGNGRVRLELQPEVSERDFTNAVNLNGFTVPGLTTRRVNTAVEMNFGQTLMLTGLLSMRKTAQTSKVPIIGDVPYLGGLFRRVRYDESETELVILVTPQLVSAVDPCEIPPGGPGLFSDVPTTRELFHYGLIEVPFYGDHCSACDGALPQPLSAPGYGTVPPAPAGGPAGHQYLTPAPTPQQQFVVPPTPAIPTAPAVPAAPAIDGTEPGDDTTMRRSGWWGELSSSSQGRGAAQQVSHSEPKGAAKLPGVTTAAATAPQTRSGLIAPKAGSSSR